MAACDRGAQGARCRIAAAVAALVGASALAAQQTGPGALRWLDDPNTPYRTALSGEGLRTTLFGDPYELQPRDRRSVDTVTLGVADAMHADEGTTPYGSLYLWRRPNDRSLLRAVLAGVYDEVLFTHGPFEHGDGSFELVGTFENWTPPWSSGELIDGEVAAGERLHWGYVRAGFGCGFRGQVGPENDNQLASDLIVEPGLLYFGRADDTDPAFVVPDSTFELRVRWQLRFDQLTRNLLDLPHRGYALGADAVWGWRADSDAWGLPGTEFHSGDEGRDYVQATGYVFAIGDLPFVASERWRLFGSAHGGAGSGVDRFSAQRVGGGPDLRGQEFGTTARPLLPGAAIGEFFPEHYAIGSVGVRSELTWFAFLDAGVTVARLDRDRDEAGTRQRGDDTFVAIAARLASGFFGNFRLQIDYAYDFDVVRSGDFGGHELVVQMSKHF